MPAPQASPRAFRSFFSPAPGLVHLNNGGVSPLTTPARDALLRWTKEISERALHVDPEYWSVPDRARAELARLLGCEIGELAFFGCAAAAISQAAEASGVGPGDEILIWGQEYPSAFYPWRALAERVGARLVVAPDLPSKAAPVERLLDLATSRTRAIAVSWVQFQTGAVTDLRALADFARPRGIFTCVDVIQGAGVLPFDFASSDLDAIAGGSQKWLCGPEGVGYLALRRGLIARTRPLSSGAYTYGNHDGLASMDAQPKPEALRFEPGTLPRLLLAAAGASYAAFNEVGVENVSAEALRLAKKLRQACEDLGYRTIAPHGDEQRSPIVAFAPGTKSPLKTVDEMKAALAEAKISFALRGGGVRLSPHGHNSDADVEAAKAAWSMRSAGASA